jgi:hypothetical protein
MLMMMMLMKMLITMTMMMITMTIETKMCASMHEVTLALEGKKKTFKL